MKSKLLKPAVISLLFFTFHLYSKTYFVSPSGINSNPGSYGSPWATPGYGSKQISAGDSLIIRTGEYFLSLFWDDMITPNSGTADEWIVIQGESGSRPVLKGNNNLFSAIELSNVNYIKILNLEITSDNGADFRVGIAAWDPASHIILEDLYIHHIDETAIDFRDVQVLEINSCTFDHCGFGCIGGPAGAAGGWRFIIITGCSLTYSGHYYQGVTQPGISPYDRPDGFGIEPSEGPIEIKDCYSAHNRGDGLDSKAARTTIHQCIVANNRCDGIKLWGDSSRVHNCLIYGTGDGDVTSPWSALVIDNMDVPDYYFEILNTTIHDNPARPAYPMYVQYSGSASLDLVMKNNIISNGHGVVYFGNPVNLTAEYNLFHRPGENIQVWANGRNYTIDQINQGDLGIGNKCADPFFVSPAWGTSGDFHLQPISPAIDAGVLETGIPDTDLEYRQRPLGDGLDMGAFEFTPVLIQTRIFLEGPFHMDGDTMTTAIYRNGLIPTCSPFPENPREIAVIPGGIADWILVQLRETFNGPPLLSKSVLLRQDGFLVSDDGSTPVTLNCDPGYYYLVLKHRNHLSVMSADSIYLSSEP